MAIVQYKPSCSNPVSFPTRQHINNGITNAKGGMPAKFRGADGGASFAMGRNSYSNTTLANESYNLVSLTDAFKKKGCTCSASCNHMSCNCKVCNSRFNSDTRFNRYSGCNVGKSINVQSSDQYIQRRKNQAIGRGSMPGQQTDNTGSYKLSFKTTYEIPSTNQHTSVANTALRKIRSSGNVPPPKVAARPTCRR